MKAWPSLKLPFPLWSLPYLMWSFEVSLTSGGLKDHADDTLSLKILWSTPWNFLILQAATPSRSMKSEQSVSLVDWSVVWGIFHILCPSQQSVSTWNYAPLLNHLIQCLTWSLTWNHCALGTSLGGSVAQGQHICCRHSAYSTGSAHHTSSHRGFQGWAESLSVPSPCISLSDWCFCISNPCIYHGDYNCCNHCTEESQPYSTPVLLYTCWHWTKQERGFMWEMVMFMHNDHDKWYCGYTVQVISLDAWWAEEGIIYILRHIAQVIAVDIYRRLGLLSACVYKSGW